MGGGGTKPEKEVLGIGCHSALKQPKSGLKTNEASASAGNAQSTAHYSIPTVEEGGGKAERGIKD